MAVNPVGPAPLPALSEPMTVAPTVAAGDDWANKGNITAFDKADGPSFSDVLDIINPLQHIPIINTIYQKLTGDTEGAVADVVGGTLYGGLIGLGAAVAGLVIQDSTGKSVSDHVIAMFTDDSSSTAIAQKEQQGQPTRTALAPPEAPPAPAAAPTEPVTTAPLPVLPAVTDGPVRAGDFLIFGSSAAAPMAAPTASSGRPAVLTPSAPVAAPDGPTRQGDFLVFGSNGTPPATSLPDTTASAIQAQVQAQQTASTEPRFRPVPARTGPSRPQATLPMPTTGPGALPGGHSQANGQGASYPLGNPMNGLAGSAAPPSATGLPPGDARQWFDGAFSQAMDKYQRAAALKGDAANLMPPPASAPAAAAAPLN